MPFTHKLPRRLALLKDLAWGVPVVLLLSCELPLATITAALDQITLSPTSKMVRVNQTTSIAALITNATGSTIVGPTVSFRVHGTSGGQIASTADSASRKVCHYQASATPGLDTVIASLESGAADTAVIQVTQMPVAAVQLWPTVATVSIGTTIPFIVNLRDSLGNAVSGRGVTWRSTATSVGIVDASGTATALAVGTTSIIATSEGVSDTTVVTVVTTPVATVIVTPPTANVNVGATTTFSATTQDA
ncbi:MAG TPA: Ig-like domain-containing protein, partial [Mycobacterium sp.]|nr:Ig-like domain-containing protein [Mycobacterium sp.]